MSPAKLVRPIPLLVAMTCCSTAIAEDAYVDFSDRATSVCEVLGLTVKAPSGWISVPIEAGDEEIEGCQMMLIDDEALIGILRLLSVQIPEAVDAQKMLVGIEAQALVSMNYELGEPLWRKDDLSVEGIEGFGGGKALAVSLSLPGNDRPQEGHFLTFHGPDAHYVLTLLTPARSVDDGIHYASLTQGLMTVMQTLQPRPTSGVE